MRIYLTKTEIFTPLCKLRLNSPKMEARKKGGVVALFRLWNIKCY